MIMKWYYRTSARKTKFKLRKTKSKTLGGTKMKKVIALILAALMVLGLAACAAKTTTTEQDTDTPAQTAPADKAAEETTAADAADKQITVGFCHGSLQQLLCKHR